MKRSFAIVVTLVLAACGGGSDLQTGVIVRAATGPANGGADIQYFGLLLFVDGDIPPSCPTVGSFTATVGPPHTVTGVLDGTTPVSYTHAVLADIDDTAAWVNKQISDDVVFPMLPVGSQVRLCTYPLDASLQTMSNCTTGSDTGTPIRGVLALTGESSCTTPQDGAVVGVATGNNSPTLTVLNADLDACANGSDIAFTHIQIDDPDGDDVTLTVNVVSAPAGAVVSPNAPINVSSGGTITVTAAGPGAGAVVLEYALLDAFNLAGDGPFSVTMNLNVCPAP